MVGERAEGVICCGVACQASAGEVRVVFWSLMPGGKFSGFRVLNS